jgi:hypothetical protein
MQLLYNWRDQLDETDPLYPRSRELIRRKQITLDGAIFFEQVLFNVSGTR